ncbi:MAG: lipopolysaccharide/colanic/teichoic acid biosynthesis glycosyltransferase [Candidatus Paceibacteria bacterium]|jgi:lipopolysaccharide/colanic/teichoic acid biosynthesis glycosyltransferase
MGERARELYVLIVGDIIVFNVALWVMLLVRYLEVPSFERLAMHVPPFLTFSAVWFGIFFISGLYDKHTNLLKKLLVNRILSAQITNVVVAAVLFFIIPFGIAPKTNLVLYLVISIILLSLWRLKLVPRLSPKQRHKAVLIANGKEAIELADEINNNDRYNYYFIRIIDEQTLLNTKNFETKIKALMEKEKIELIVADPRGEAIRSFLPDLFNLSFLHFACTFLDFNRLYEDTFDRVPVHMLQYEWFITNISQSKSSIYDAVKRVVDILGSLALLVPSLVLFPFAALAIKIEDKGPLFYSTTRVGQFNKLITIFKLRTKNGSDVGPSALKSTLVDTKVGLILRKARIDELPQLINVLRGDLSFIGPRPEMPALAEVYAKEIPYYNTRHFLKPGLSGWAQINNYDVPRGGVDVERTVTKLSYDLFYLERRSLFLDIQIALKTISTIIMRSGT